MKHPLLESPTHRVTASYLLRLATWRVAAHRIGYAVLAIAVSAICSGAERAWQTGTWAEVTVKREVVDFGPGGSPFGPGAPAASMRAMADVRTYVIETNRLRLELKEVAPIGHTWFEAVVGQLVTFAIDKKTVYVRDTAGAEHRVQLLKQMTKPAR